MKIAVGFSFGSRLSSPGLSNEALAAHIQKFAPECSVVQKEIGIALAQNGFIADHVIHSHTVCCRYLDTDEVARQIAEFLKSRKIDNFPVTIFAHTRHMHRCKYALEQFGISCIPVDVEIPYDMDSVQWWTRSPCKLAMRELLALPYYTYARMIKPRR